MDPHAQPGGAFTKALMMAMYKGKVVATGLAIKFLVGKFTEPQFGQKTSRIQHVHLFQLRLCAYLVCCGYFQGCGGSRGSEWLRRPSPGMR